MYVHLSIQAGKFSFSDSRVCSLCGGFSCTYECVKCGCWLIGAVTDRICRRRGMGCGTRQRKSPKPQSCLSPPVLRTNNKLDAVLWPQGVDVWIMLNAVHPPYTNPNPISRLPQTANHFQPFMMAVCFSACTQSAGVSDWFTHHRLHWGVNRSLFASPLS